MTDAMLFELAIDMEADEAFMSYVLAQYSHIENLEKDALAAHLGIPLILLTRLSLCKRPNADSPNFVEEINEIADFTLADEEKLVQMIRQIDSLTSFRDVVIEEAIDENALNAPFFNGILAAARDRTEDETSE